MYPIMAAVMAAATIAAPAASVRDGTEAWQQGAYDRAVAIWRPLADAGDADAAFDLAQAYKLGRGLPADLALAKSWYGKAARAGHPQAIANYGLLLYQDGDRQAAMPWIAKASEAGDARAQYAYGTALFNGDLAPRDWPRAYALLTRSASAGLPQATTSLAQIEPYLSEEDRRRGRALAAEMASQPLPPTDRHVVSGTSSPATGGGATIAPEPSPSPPAAARSRPTVSGVAPPTVLHPKPTALAPSGRWRVQLGAYGSQEQARLVWERLAKASALHGLTPAYEKSGSIVRLRAGPLPDRTAAARTCSAAQSAGTPCFAIAPARPGEQA
jgi:uncharacterized protein